MRQCIGNYRTMVGLGIALAVVLCGSVQAADYSLTANDALNTSSFNTAGNWSGGGAPSAGNNYLSAGYYLRTPPNNNTYVFQGNSLTLSGGGMAFKGNGPITVNDLRIDGGWVGQWQGNTNTPLNGTVTVQAGGGTFSSGSGRTITVNASISGPGAITANGDGNLVLNAANTYTGDTTVNAGTSTLNGSLLMDINSTGDFTQLLGTGTVDLNGALRLDVADVTGSGSWLLVDVVNLTETFDTGFSIAMNAGPTFTESSDIWTYSDAGGDWMFTEATGVLDFAVAATGVIPEPSTFLIWSLGLLGLVGWRRRRRTK